MVMTVKTIYNDGAGVLFCFVLFGGGVVCLFLEKGTNQKILNLGSLAYLREIHV